ncbi:MAG: DUF5703 domain-containing protein [Kiritimatiellae bacterium]|nr:DUF5703 domain-containing protein [Kiritimatiellia bacterium]
MSAGTGRLVGTALTSLAVVAVAAPLPAPLVWTTPGRSCRDSMPLGNGDVAVNVWTEPDETLHVLVAKSDAWDEYARLVKIGAVVFQLPAGTFAEPFRQSLDLASGSLTVADRIRVWVDAHHPIVRIETTLRAEPRLALWRTNRFTYAPLQASDVLLDRQHPARCRAPTIIEPDTIAEATPERLVWFRHNAKSVGFPETRRIQGLEGYPQADPVLHRTFGAALVRLAHGYDLHVLTRHPSTPAEWRSELERRIREAPAPDFDAHRRWWAEFWQRSWIRASTRPDLPRRALAFVPTNAHPLRVGEDQEGRNRWAGELRGVCVPADLAGGFVLEAEVKPAAGERGRIFDKITPGGSDGFLLDAHPGNALRLISGRTVIVVSNALPAAQWAKIVAVADPTAGAWRVTVNGREVIRTAEVADGADAEHLSRMYELQRFINACAGRGVHPIKFNGSLFTVAPADGSGDHDFRRWGPGYWWQNTRLPYVSMCASGDLDLMQPLVRMYVDDMLPLCVHRTHRYLGHRGAFYPECVYFWGAIFSETYGWTPFEERTDKLQQSRWHKWEWVAGPELAWMLLDLWEHAPDEEFFRTKVLPTCREVLRFFEEHYRVGADGRLVMEPAQALETWWDCTNPMPELAGCIAVSERLLALAETPEADREWLRRFRAKLPELPLREVPGGKLALAPAARYAEKRNQENPELYAVFPFRLIAVGKPRLEWGIEAFRHRLDRGHAGWRQDDIFAAYLGLAGEARQLLVRRSREHDRNHRFPAFWGPNYDWTPDQDHGSVLMKAFQAMLLQTDGRVIRLLPAWPVDWDVDFKLHAPHRTVVEGRVSGGRLVELRVSPESRRPDVIVGEPQS